MPTDSEKASDDEEGVDISKLRRATLGATKRRRNNPMLQAVCSTFFLLFS